MLVREAATSCNGPADGSNDRPRIVVLVAHFPPAFRSGGPARSVAGLVAAVPELDFRVICAASDWGSSELLPGIVADEWQRWGSTPVRYSTQLGPRRLVRELRRIEPDAIYLNSFFNTRWTFLPLVLRWLRLLPPIPVVLAPRGEFSPGALKLKRIKKRAYLWLVRRMKLTDGVHWQASASQEEEDIRRLFPHASIRIAPDLRQGLEPVDEDSSRARPDAPLSVVFLSRITEKKNLLGAIDAIGRASCDVELVVAGPIADERYWARCLKRVEELGLSERFSYHGVVAPENVVPFLARFDLFFFPTEGENYGHVIPEALAAGIPVLLSDTTPWNGVEQRGAGWIHPVADADGFARRIDAVAAMSSPDREIHRSSARELASKISTDPTLVEANRRLFADVVDHQEPLPVHFIHRRPLPGQVSLERVFADVGASLPFDVAPVQHILPRPSTGLWNRVWNTLSAARWRRSITHVTGDVHYACLLLHPRRSVLTVHDLVNVGRLKGWRRRLFVLVWYRLPVRRATAVTTGSEWTKDQLIELIPSAATKIRVIHAPVSPEFKPEVPKRAAPAVPRLLLVGTAENKNLEGLVGAIEGLEVHLRIVGELSAEQRKLLEAKAVDYSSVSGLSRKEVADEYQQADVVTFVSTYEGFGLPIVEAQASGRPVITSNIASMPEVAGGAALLVDPSDKADIRSAVMRLLDDAGLYEDLVRRGLANVERFRAERVAGEYGELYRELAAQRRSRSAKERVLTSAAWDQR